MKIVTNITHTDLEEANEISYIQGFIAGLDTMFDRPKSYHEIRRVMESELKILQDKDRHARTNT